ncbi:hypothetical protein [Methylobacterium gnaphalii]|uniref:Uncharacterized protein n=1 Tax=Methylobacterium gnaphalii TaxID=1010610 RepID=A0A512JP31_9HYPH|nr:hypothetical protein [Methylobacterium gnaphalii]GEP11698.1 hypothetical protein MGN01_35430 [Methylobacterium gnaphalii]GJD68787.1 hypothetical protein MMMDOFMJ_1711 [Methylobacterium gnaphalii]GLS50195.1 hypothetical protein GCM10007885_30470 [Methylobacterium gnaphalii]
MTTTSNNEAAGAAWVLVPREPTEEMMKVGSAARWQSPIRDADSVYEIYRAMLAAAPIPRCQDTCAVAIADADGKPCLDCAEAAAALAKPPSQSGDLEELKRLSEAATKGTFYTVDQPWGHGDWIVAGSPDPHAGKPICTFDDVLLGLDVEEEQDTDIDPQDNAAFVAAAVNYVRALLSQPKPPGRLDRETSEKPEAWIVTRRYYDRPETVQLLAYEPDLEGYPKHMFDVVPLYRKVENASAKDAILASAGTTGDGGEDEPHNEATQVTLGEGLVDITVITHEGKSGVLFRPRAEKIPFGEPGELPEGDYWPVAGDVVLWVSGEGPQVAIDALTALAKPAPAPNAAIEGAVPAGHCPICGRSDKPPCQPGPEADECGRRAMFDQFGEQTVRGRSCQGMDPNEPYDPLKVAVWAAILPFRNELLETGGVTFMGLRNAVVEAVRSFAIASQASLAASSSPQGNVAGWQSQAASDVLAERSRKLEAEGCTFEYDDTQTCGEMARAASCYAERAALASQCVAQGLYAPKDIDAEVRLPTPANWPWDRIWWKFGSRRQALVKAGALILAEIERLDRASLPAVPASGKEG